MPKDPLDGAGEEPPADDDPTTASLALPGTLGNGLVHDSRLLLEDAESTWEIDNGVAGEGLAWAGRVDEFDEMMTRGFRPHQINAKVSVTALGSDNYRITVDDDSVYISDDDANYLHEVETYLFASVAAESGKTDFAPAIAGLRPVSIDSFVIANASPGGLQTGFTVAWVRDEKQLPWRMVAGLGHTAFELRLAELVKEGFRPISISSRRFAGGLQYSAVFVADGVAPAEWALMLGVKASDFASLVKTQWDAEKYPVQASTRFASDTLPQVDILWRKRPPEFRAAIRYNMTDATFASEDASLRAQGYHLDSADVYQDGGERWWASWVRYRPFLRWTGTQFAEDDKDYTKKYQPFHDRLLVVMENKPLEDADASSFSPSATLHIFEGDELVLNRAYTYAPSIYPDTEIDAPFRYASVAKSITAAVVVKEMAVKQLPVTTPIVSALGLQAGDYPPAMANVSVLSTLRLLGGFQIAPSGYWDHHEVVAELAGATLPIDGGEALQHAVVNGLFFPTAPEPRRYWVDPVGSSTIRYANPAYTIAGEIIPGLTGFSYRGYTQHFLSELGIDIHPDPEHRYARLGPINAGKGTYLINGSHPYRNAMDPPVLGTGALPVETWRKSAIPDPDAPGFVARARYGGMYSLSGAPLAAGGWAGSGDALGRLIRAIVVGDAMPIPVADQLWHPQWANMNNTPATGWAYGLGWYMRGNWVAMAGGTDGAAAVALHNRAYDFTVVILLNNVDNLFGPIINPIFQPKGLGNLSPNAVMPCVNEDRFPQNECTIGFPYQY